MLTRELPDALEMTEKALAIDSTHLKCIYRLARVYELQQEYELAEEQYLCYGKLVEGEEKENIEKKVAKLKRLQKGVEQKEKKMCEQIFDRESQEAQERDEIRRRQRQ